MKEPQSYITQGHDGYLQVFEGLSHRGRIILVLCGPGCVELGIMGTSRKKDNLGLMSGKTS